MYLSSLRVRNFLTFDQNGFVFEDLGDTVFLVGPNGSGKTSVLRSIEFVSDVLQRKMVNAANHVHRQDLTRGIDIDVALRLHPDEQRIVVTAALLAFGKEVRTSQGDAKLDHQEANRVVHQVLTRCRHLFEPLFAGVVHYCTRTSPGQSQVPEAYVRVASSAGDLCIDRDGHLSRAPFRSSGWAVVSLPDEIYRRIREARPGAFERERGKTEYSTEFVKSIADSFTPEWLYSCVEPRDGMPTSLSSEPIQRDSLSKGQVGVALDDDLALEGFLRAAGEQFPNLSLFDVLARLYISSIQGLTEERSKVASLGAGHPWAPWEPGTGPLSFDLPRGLFDLKNSLNLGARNQFLELRAEFNKLTGVSFDVAWESREIPPTQSGAPTRYVGLPVLTFHEAALAYPGVLAAAGFCELLLVLSGAFGSTESVVLLDEPALNLHPVKQRELLRVLSRLATAANNQLIIVSHSPEFVESRSLPKSFRLALVEGATKVKRLKIDEVRHAGKVGKLVEVDPSVAGALFAKRVVLVEGHAEAVALPTWLAKCDAGIDFGALGLLFLNVEGQDSFPWYADAMEAWGIPYRLVGDKKAAGVLSRFGVKGHAYQDTDFSALLSEHCKESFERARITWGGGEKNPLVAQAVALETDPPPPIQEIWRFLKPFVLGNED